MELTITHSSRRDEDLLEVAGVLDHGSVPYLRHVVFDLFDERRRRITVDVSGLRILDAASIRSVLYLRERSHQLNGDVRLTGATGTVLTALEITGVAKQLAVYAAFDWPMSVRQRRAVNLDALRPHHGQWPMKTTELVLRLHAMAPNDPTRPAFRDEIIGLCLPTAHRLAHRYTGTSEPVADLAQVAALGLVKAVDGFDTTRGVEFAMYATPTVLGELKRYFRDRTFGVRIPRRLQELRMAVNTVRDELTQRLGRAPTAADLAAQLGVDEEQIAEMLSATNGNRPLSLDVPMTGLGENTALQDVIGGDDPTLGMVEWREALRVLLARLPKRQQQILSLRFYGNLSQSEIAERVGLSQMHVSRLLRQSLNLLHRRLTE